MQSLDCGRRADAETETKPRDPAIGAGITSQHGTNKDRNRTVLGRDLDASMGHRANRALVTGKLGVFRMDVDGLNESGKATSRTHSQS